MRNLRQVLRALLPDLLVGVGLFVIPLAFFWQVTIGGRTLLPADNMYQYEPFASYRADLGVPAVPHNMLLSDLVLENLPWKQFIRQSIADREIPLWNPYIFAGTPFLAEGQHSGLYPFSVIYYVLPLDKAYGWYTVSQLWLAGLFMYLLMRGLGLRRFGAILAAIAYMMSSFFVASVVFQMIIAAAAWLPFLLLMVEFTLRERPLLGRPTATPWIALGAVGLGMEVLAGHVEFTYYALLVMGFWAACRLGWMLIRQGKTIWKQTARSAFSLIALVVLGMGIGAIQFVPLYDLARYNFREGSAPFDQVRGYAFPARHALAFLMPNLYGSPAQHDYFDVFSGQTQPFSWTRADGSVVTDTYWEVNKNYVEGACYVGLLTLCLAAIALLHAVFERAPDQRIGGPYRGIFALLGIISVSFIFGTVAYAILYYGLPGINQLHSPFRWVYPLTLCLAALAGFGAEALQKAAEGVVSFTRRLAIRFGYGIAALGVLVLVGLIASRVFFERLRGPIESLFHKLAGADSTFPDVQTFYSVEFRSILIFAILLILCGIVIRLSQVRLAVRQIPVWTALAILVLTGDLVIASAGFNPAADPAWLHFTPPAIAWLQAHDPANWRYATIETPTNKTLNANLGWVYGLQGIAGYDSIILKQYVEYVSGLLPQTQLLYNRIAAFTTDTLPGALSKDQMAQLGVRYLISSTALDSTQSSSLTLAYQDRGTWIYENSAARPRAYLTGGDDSAPAWQKAANTIDIAQPGAQIVQAGASQIIVTTQAESPAWLILNNSYAPGWRAYLQSPSDPTQETEVPTVNAFGNFIGVRVPAGQATVRIKYSPPAFQIGAFTTFVSFVILVFALLLWGWRLFYGQITEDSGGVRRLAKNTFAPIALNLFNRGIDFGFALVMLRLLDPVGTGIYYYAVVIFGWFDILTNFGLNTWLTREVARDRSLARRYLFNTTALRLFLVIACVPLLMLYLGGRFLITPSTNATDAAQNTLTIWAIVLLYMGLLPSSLSTGLTALFYAFEKAEIPAAVSTVTAILKATLGLTVLLLGWNVVGLAGASIVLNVITLVILALQARPLLRSVPQAATATGLRAWVDRTVLRAMMIESWPLMLNHLLATLFFKIDVTLLEPLKGSTVVGWYSAAYKWVDALGVIPSLFTMALMPLMSRLGKEDKAGLDRAYQFAVKLLVMTALPLAVMITFLAPLMIGILGGAKFLPDGAIALQLMIWFITIGWINSLTNYVLIALDQQREMRGAFAIGVGFNVVFNLLLIPTFSYMASAVITVFSELVLLVGFYILLRKAMGEVPWITMLWKPIAAAALMFATFALMGVVLPNPIFAVIPGWVVYGAVLVVLRPFSSWEINRFAPLMPAPVQRWVGIAPQ
jgi:O-antigen/teichoic acid export membrane protein